MKRRIKNETDEDDDTSIYSSNVRETMLDDDELSPMEEAFMAGYEEASWLKVKKDRCLNCGDIAFLDIDIYPAICLTCKRNLESTKYKENIFISHNL